MSSQSKPEMRTIVQVDTGAGFATIKVDAFRSWNLYTMNVLMSQKRHAYPTISGSKGFPSDVTPTTDANPQAHQPPWFLGEPLPRPPPTLPILTPYYVDGFYLGNETFSWLTLDVINGYLWSSVRMEPDLLIRNANVPKIPASEACKDFYDGFLPYLNTLPGAYGVTPDKVRVLFGIVN